MSAAPNGWRWGRRIVTLGPIFALFAVGAATSGGCEALVSATIPAFACEPGPDTCPSGQTCAKATGRCISDTQACTVTGCEAGLACDESSLACTASDAGLVADGNGADGNGVCAVLGCGCRNGADCTSGVCANQGTVSANLYNAAGGGDFCTAPCCVSQDCDGSTVCFATGAGGNYCVRPEWLGRSTAVGQGQGGAPCSADSDCRSGLCAAGNCVDTCCSTILAPEECGGTATCAFEAFPGRTFDTNVTSVCMTTTGTAANGSLCTMDAQCLSNFCNVTCHDACRGKGNCAASNQTCSYVPPPQDLLGGVVAACEASVGTGMQGDACTGNAGCQSNRCDPTASRCTDICFTDSDCPTPGWRCRPESGTLVLGSTVTVLLCGS